jgi:lambda family phage portal protein
MDADGGAFTVGSDATPAQSSYKAAGQGRRLHIWRPPNSGPNSALAYELPTIRGRLRAAARNDPWEGAALDKLDANGIACGIQAKGWKPAEPLWNAWMQVCDAAGVLDGYGQQYLAWHEWNEIGEVFVRLRPRREADGLPVPLQIELIEAEQCPTDLYTTASNGNEIKAGIEFDSIGRRVAYWMHREHPGDGLLSVNGNERVRIPADRIIHLYRPVRAGQLRGIPDQASVLVRMFNLEHMDDNVLERQKLANLFAGFYTRAIDPENPDSMIEDMTAGADGEVLESDDDDTPLAGLEPGTMQELPPGVKAEFAQPPAPSSDYTEFVRGHLLAVAARHGVPFEVLTGDLRNVSDRALKLILNEFRRAIEMRQWLFFIPRYCQRIREEFFNAAVMARKLEIPDYDTNTAKYVDTLWVPQGWPYSHPVQDVTADIKAMRAGLLPRYDALLRAGEDPERVDEQIAADNARADRLGLVLDSDPRKTTPAGKPSGNTDPVTDEPPPADEVPEQNGDEDARDETP